MFGHTMLHTLFLTSVICQINFRGSRRKLQRDNPVLRIAEGFTVGSSANNRLYPFMARMVMDGAHKCGGSVISERIIATSRHCLKDCPCFPKQDWHLCPNICYIKLRETSDSQADTETIHTIEAVHLPENSGDPDNFEDYFIEDVTDFALVQLTRSVNDCEETSSSRVCWPISPVHLVGPETIIRKGDAARTIGWGATFWEESSEFLRQLNLKINSNSNFEYIMETDITPDGGDPCSGDSGGPLLIRNNNTYQWMLVATLLGGGHNCKTFEPSNPEQDKTGDWNKVTPHLKWIERVVSSTSAGYEISSNGGAKANYPELMGIYKLTGDTRNSLPTYKHENGEYYLYVNDEPYDDWIVSTSGYENTASLFAHKSSDGSRPPTVGWEYSNDGWQSDPTMRVFEHNKQGCGGGWTEWRSHCYKLFGEKLSWNDAQVTCEKEGSNLASVQSLEENQFLFNLSPEGVWIGANDKDTEGTWVWTDGSAWKLENWRAGEPNNDQGDNEHCAEMKANIQNGKWNDVQCAGPAYFPFICKKI